MAGHHRTIVSSFTGVLLALLGTQASRAADTPSEQTQLAIVVRQLDMLDRMAAHGANLPRDGESRFHFDYAQLQGDIARIRSGINDYLSPQRAQPRDLVPLKGDYRQETKKGKTP
ncbi:MAG: RAQPRD family integrative conjugative element protein [Nitrospiraceae bacterium]